MTAVATRMEGKNLKYIFILCVYWECFCSELEKCLPLGVRFPCNRSRREVLEELARPLLFPDGWRAEDGPNGLVKHSFKATLSQG